MAASSSNRRPRGATLVEVLMAAAILALGLSGLSLVMIQAAKNMREGDRRVDAALVGFGSAEELAGQLFVGQGASLVPGVYDGGTVIDDAGVVVFTRVVTVSDLGTIDGGIAYPGFHVQVQINYRDSTLTNRTQTYATIVSAPFDGGL